MPIWLFGVVVGLTSWSAFFCPRCQKLNEPHPFVVQQQGVEQVLTAIKDTPVLVPRDSLNVMLLTDAHSYYDSIYARIETCSRLPVDSTLFKSLEFYVADRASFMTEQGEALAFYDESTRSVILGVAAVWNPKVIGHEMLHAVLADHGIDSWDHPTFWFDLLCRKEVTSLRRPEDG